MKNIPKLDLHGIRHERARSDLIRFIEDNWDCGLEAEIVTGHSDKTKEIVNDVLSEYKLEPKMGNFNGTNTGMIRVEL